MSFNTHDDLNYADLLLTNTSSDIIYIDLARSFTIDQDNNCTPLYSGKTYSSTKGNDLGAGLGLGAVAAVLGIDGKVGTLLNGLSLSKNTSNYDTTTIVEQQIIAIPPHSSKVILNVRVPIFNVN